MSRLTLTKEVRQDLNAIIAEPKGRRVGVLGLGVIGTAMARHLAERGAEVVAADLRADLAADELRDLGVELRLGAMQADCFDDVEAVAIGPGADPRQAAATRVLKSGRPLFGELELAGNLSVPFVGITGTNGKSTTTALLGALLQAAGRDPFVGGNLGDSLLVWLDSKIPRDTAVVELSSFQLETAYSLRADVGIMLNVTPDHFERYDDVLSYADVKQRLVENADVAVLNHDDPIVVAMANHTSGRVVWFSTVENSVPGDGLALGAGDRVVGCGQVSYLDGFDLAHPRLFGPHNRENALAALCAAHALGALAGQEQSVRRGYVEFSGLANRLEWVGEWNGVTFINDSKATNDESARVAVAAMDKPVILLAGGRDKGTGYARLATAVGKNVKAVLAYGEAKEAVAAALSDHGRIERLASMRAAFARAVALCERGDVVLLAPACSSFDEFDNYVARGQVFRDLFGELENSGASAAEERQL